MARLTKDQMLEIALDFISVKEDVFLEYLQEVVPHPEQHHEKTRQRVIEAIMNDFKENF